VLALSLPSATVAALAAASEQGDPHLTIDLDRQELFGGVGVITFSMDADARLRLLEGLDAIDLTLRRLTDLDAYHRRDRQQRPWVYL
jgi:3-isopropylmalate/(R)-2-methylmalate dehydratase small subunit